MTQPAAPPRVLTPDEEAAIRSAISGGATDAEAGRAAGVTPRRFYAARAAELRDLPRNKRGPRVGELWKRRKFTDLPLDTIYRRAAEVRRGWDTATLIERRAGEGVLVQHSFCKSLVGARPSRA